MHMEMEEKSPTPLVFSAISPPPSPPLLPISQASIDLSKKKHQRVKNKNYRQFLDDGIIETLPEQKFVDLVMPYVRWKRSSRQARAVCITAFYTGARPIEYLDLRAKDISKEGVNIILQLRGAKRGLPRPFIISAKKHPLIEEVYKLARRLHPDMYLFSNFRNVRTIRVMNKKGKLVEYKVTGDRLLFWFKKWFAHVYDGSIPPYFLRHNRFSRLMMNDATYEDIRVAKGSRSLNSVMPYVHMSTRQAKKISKLLD